MKVVIFLCTLIVISFGQRRDFEEEEEALNHEDGAEYLKSVIGQLLNQKLPSSSSISLEQNTVENFKIMGPTPLPEIDSRLQDLQTRPSDSSSIRLPPPEPLTKDEIAALYQAAINKGATLDLAGMTAGTFQNLQELHAFLGQNILQQNAPGSQDEQGFYYYFYPIKSFDRGKDQVKNNEVKPAVHANGSAPVATMIPTAMMIMEQGGNKSVEPLFMAIASFVGMALMFVFSVLFLPKFGTLRSRGITALKQAPDDLAALTKLVLDAIDGKDCSERIACEVGQAIRKMQLDRKPLRVLELILPQYFSKQLSMVRKASTRKERCTNIPCKVKKV